MTYQRDYFPAAGSFGYGMSDVIGGKSDSLRHFEPEELEGVARTIGIGGGGSGFMFSLE